MFVPGISKRSSSSLERRKGGGGGGKGGGGGGGKSSGSSGGKSSGGSVGGATPRTSSSGLNFGGKSKSSSSYSRGGGAAAVIPAGLPFAGRSAGGGTRDQVYGSRSYGSGYGSGFAGRGVGGRPFPFFFWPIVFGGGAFLVADTYLDARQEYGNANNSTRPGGPLATTTFQSTLATSNSTFRVVADNNTVTSLISDVSQNCSVVLVTNPAPTSTPLDPNGSIPRPEQVIQYYRASSVALTLDGYNNTATYAPDGTPDSPLPSNVDMTLLTCLNQTIGAAVPLVNGANGLWVPPHFNLIGLVCALWVLMKFN